MLPVKEDATEMDMEKLRYGDRGNRWYECWCCGHRIYFKPGTGTKAALKQTIFQHARNCDLGKALKTLL